MKLMRSLFYLLLFFAAYTVTAETWQDALRRMPLGARVPELNRTNCVKVMLPAFQANDTVKALIFMPGATDEFYMFRRARATLTNDSPTLLDAVTALTNQTLIRATFRPPLLLLHTTEDVADPLVEIKDLKTAYRLETTPFVEHAIYDDRDWDFLLPILKHNLHARFTPRLYSRDSFHFFRHSFVGWNLNGWEALEAISLAGKTRFTIDSKEVDFEGDVRFMAQPNLEHLQR